MRVQTDQSRKRVQNSKRERGHIIASQRYGVGASEARVLGSSYDGRFEFRSGGWRGDKRPMLLHGHLTEFTVVVHSAAVES
ncbi:unnamed protein product [Penicillium roqueforti FM164]|uniref:Uncharacterized protein n=1 Tax=Penicillium roqueforti (strain FM164) TaxID=1365484 RepID=W6QIL3_PENRF|nr:unnamed protein product [Penicillium roqueforti FM164]